MSEQTELRSLAGYYDTYGGGHWKSDADLLKRAADKLDRLTALVAMLEENGDG